MQIFQKNFFEKNRHSSVDVKKLNQNFQKARLLQGEARIFNDDVRNVKFLVGRNYFASQKLLYDLIANLYKPSQLSHINQENFDQSLELT